MSINELMSAYRYEFFVTRDPEIPVEEPLKPMLFSINNLDQYVDKVDWNSEKAVVSYLIPNRFSEKIDAVNFIKFLIFNCFKTINLRFKDNEGNKIATFTGIVDNSQDVDWNLDLIESTKAELLKINIIYNFKTVMIA